MIVDGHAHIMEASYGGIDRLLEQFSEAGIDKAVLVPGGMLDVRKMTKHITGEAKPDTLIPPNWIVKKYMEAYPDKFFGFYCVDPHQGEAVLDDFSAAVKSGFSGLKLAPMVHQFSLTSNTVMLLAELCGELGVPFYSHVVFSPAASTKKMELLAKKFPKTTFILGHMGFGPADTDAIDYAMEHENLYLETSQGSFLIICEALKRLGPSRIIFGSEYPMYHPAASLANIYSLRCSDSDKELILGGNILQLLKKQAHPAAAGR